MRFSRKRLNMVTVTRSTPHTRTNKKQSRKSRLFFYLVALILVVTQARAKPESKVVEAVHLEKYKRKDKYVSS
jgi:hypothetical protein